MGWLTCRRASIVISTSSSLSFSSRIFLNATPVKLGSLNIKSDGEGVPFKNSFITSTRDCSKKKKQTYVKAQHLDFPSDAIKILNVNTRYTLLLFLALSDHQKTLNWYTRFILQDTAFSNTSAVC